MFVLLLVAACSTRGTVQPDPVQATQHLIKEVRAGNTAGPDVDLLYDSRAWVPSDALSLDPVEAAKTTLTPTTQDNVKLLGSYGEDPLRSLAVKIWMIENARHTIDAVYYIFKPDLAGNAILGALCNAVQRRVDVRIVVDAAGSFSFSHNHLRALETCSQNAPYIRDANGRPTRHQARVQVVIFNAFTKMASRINRRSHDKLLLVDAAFPGKAAFITGGRNISLDYYGIKDDGNKDPNAYRDMEVVVRPGDAPGSRKLTSGQFAEIFFSLLFLHEGNRCCRRSITANKW